MEKGKAVVYEVYSCEVVANVAALSSTGVDWVLNNIDTSGIVSHNRFVDSITKWCEYVNVPESLTR